MRSAGAGLFGALLMVAPLVAIPILAVVGVPQFAPAIASLDPGAVDTELSADLANDSDTPRGPRKRTSRGASAARSEAAELFSEYPDDVDLASDTESGDTEGPPPGARNSVREGPKENDDVDEETSAPAFDSSAGSRQRLGNDWEVEDPEADMATAGRSGTRPLPSPRSSSGSLARERQGGASTDQDASQSQPIDVMGETADSGATGRRGSAGTRDENRQWSNQAPNDRLGEWEAETQTAGPAARRSDQYASTAEGAIDFMAPRSDRVREQAPRGMASAPRSGNPPTRSTSTPPANAAPPRSPGPARSAPSAPARVRPIPGDSASAPVRTVQGNTNTELGDSDEVVEPMPTPLTRDRIRKQFRDPLDSRAVTDADSKDRSGAPVTPTGAMDFSPSDVDLASGRPLTPAETGEPESGATPEGSPLDADLGAEDEARTASVDPSTTSGVNPGDAIASEQLSWTEAKDRLKDWGINAYRVRNTDDGRFLFYCTAPDRKTPQISRRFEAEADTPLEAVNMAIAEIAAWYGQSGVKSDGSKARRTEQ